MNHPDAVYWGSEGQQAPGCGALARTCKRLLTLARKKGYGRAIDWPRADHIRRAAVALGESYSRDLYTMAPAALRAALRNEDSLLELLQPHKPGKPATPARAAAIEMHA